MKKYLVQVKFEIDDDIVVAADSPEQAIQLAVDTLATIYTVTNSEIDEPVEFDDIYGYDPEELD